MRINLNTILLVLAGLGVFAPGIASVAAWLASMNVAWLGTVIKGLGLLAAFCSAAPLVVPRLRAFLASLGLATAPGARAPWDPTKTIPPSDAEDRRTTPGLPLALLILAGSLLLSSAAWAQTPTPSPQFGGCFAGGQVCLGPSASITLGELNLSTSKFSGGIIPGVGYGATYAQDQWYATGLSFYCSFKAGQDGPNQAIPSLVVSFANYVRIGTGVALTETSGPIQTQWLLLFGLGSDFGGSPKYQAAKIKAAGAGVGK